MMSLVLTTSTSCSFKSTCCTCQMNSMWCYCDQLVQFLYRWSMWDESVKGRWGLDSTTAVKVICCVSLWSAPMSLLSFWYFPRPCGLLLLLPSENGFIFLVLSLCPSLPFHQIVFCLLITASSLFRRSPPPTSPCLYHADGEAAGGDKIVQSRVILLTAAFKQKKKKRQLQSNGPETKLQCTTF